MKKAEVKAQKAAEKKRAETRCEKKGCQGTKCGSIMLKEEQNQLIGDTPNADIDPNICCKCFVRV